MVVVLGMHDCNAMQIKHIIEMINEFFIKSILIFFAKIIIISLLSIKTILKSGRCSVKPCK